MVNCYGHTQGPRRHFRTGVPLTLPAWQIRPVCPAKHAPPPTAEIRAETGRRSPAEHKRQAPGPELVWAPYLPGQSVGMPGREGVRVAVVSKRAAQSRLGAAAGAGVRRRKTEASGWQSSALQGPEPLPHHPGSANSACTSDAAQGPLEPTPHPGLPPAFGPGYSHSPGRSHFLAGGKTAALAHRSWAGTVTRSAVAGPGAVPQRAAWSRPGRSAPAAAEALGWPAGWAEANRGGCMDMEAAAGQWAVCWYPRGHPEEKQGKRKKLTPRESPSARVSHPVKPQPSSTQTCQRSTGCPQSPAITAHIRTRASERGHHRPPQPPTPRRRCTPRGLEGRHGESRKEGGRSGLIRAAREQSPGGPG